MTEKEKKKKEVMSGIRAGRPGRVGKDRKDSKQKKIDVGKLPTKDDGKIRKVAFREEVETSEIDILDAIKKEVSDQVKKEMRRIEKERKAYSEYLEKKIEGRWKVMEEKIEEIENIYVKG